MARMSGASPAGDSDGRLMDPNDPLPAPGRVQVAGERDQAAEDHGVPHANSDAHAHGEVRLFPDGPTSTVEAVFDGYRGYVQSDDDSDAESTDSDIEHSFFVERHGRLFHYHGNLPYPLPADELEQNRQIVQHLCLQHLLGSNFVGPVPELLSPDGGEGDICVLDLGTGTGRWVMEMAHQYPTAHFVGIDIVPIYPASDFENVTFQLGNIMEPLNFANESFDIVHARCISTSVRDYPELLREIARVLKPGGLFIGGEWARRASFAPHRDPDRDLAVHAPGIQAMFEAISSGLRDRKGIDRAFGPVMAAWLSDTGVFNYIVEEKFYMPIGDWPTHADASALRGVDYAARFSRMSPDDITDHLKIVGNYFRAVIDRYAKNMCPMLLESGNPLQSVKDLLRRYRHDLRHVEGMVCVYHAVHARKM
ncbi:S-adenosyl-L-methionine-dependent methyltransferase [Punctularia strigosozonata HHB-11173 SS5]|uniref:S-adenosyl-L-methionine-dependent methyltransferase n=1 Tax=Punctularia strigosozonata (strain HHB-11173) TaxID=741275 RepID=R7S4F1_PUNST|nr:S-adenosyl-L-methionine-dependent methyltransferase [Punctularia strigosozonata HHB-11173 SS5]EIN05108.1 S-adenosyl-L-methionine-dependent methyltransferase [Punctularia strigosozonata HHB-11173 SS5]